MNDNEPPTWRITIWTRLLAGLFFLICLAVSIVVIRDFVRGRSLARTIPWYEAALLIPFMMAFIPAVAFVVFPGRLPKYWLEMERRARTGQQPRPISSLWHWKPRFPRWLRRTCLMLLALIPAGYAVAITVNAMTQRIDGRQLGLLIFVWLLAAVVIASVLRWWTLPAWNADDKTE